MSSQNHNHAHCSDEHGNSGHDHHDHDHGPSDDAPSDNLFSRIDHSNVVALNCASAVPAKVLKAWHQRMDENISIESDADDQLILRVPFTGNVKLRAILIKAGPGDQTPAKVAIFANEDSLDFEDAMSKPPTQEFDMPQGREIGQYDVKPAKFPSVSSVTLFFPASQGAETVQLYYVGFLGTWTERKNDPVIAVYESHAMLADHDKIQGTDGATQPPST